MNLAVRSDAPEAMDSLEDPAVYARCLRDLARVNAVTRTHAPTLAFLRRRTRDWPRGRALSVLDVACGQGDLLRAIHDWATRRGLVPILEGIDLNPRSAREAAATTYGMAIAWRTGDVFAYRPVKKPDFIVTSQFTHHLDNEQLVVFLRWLTESAGQGWMIADLHRHPIPYYGFRLLARAFGWHRIVREDGTISIARAFIRADWAMLLKRAGVEARITWRFPFRYTVESKEGVVF